MAKAAMLNQEAKRVSRSKLVRIISDGTSHGTRVFDREGKEILRGDIRRVSVFIEPMQMTRVVIELLNVAVDTRAEASVYG